MNDLVKVVADMHQDIKQIRQAQSLQGAQGWIAKQPASQQQFYKAESKDLDEDTVPEVVIRAKYTQKVAIWNPILLMDTPQWRVHFHGGMRIIMIIQIVWRRNKLEPKVTLHQTMQRKR
jgi:hypothetical protein